MCAGVPADGDCWLIRRLGVPAITPNTSSTLSLKQLLSMANLMLCDVG
jgi:hypothetical protein